MTRADLQQRLVSARHMAAVATAFMLPISTSGQAIAVSVFIVLALATLDRAHFLETMRSPAAYLPALLFALLLIGVSWSHEPFGYSIKWVGPYLKLLLIPLVMATAFTREQALQIGYGFVAACLIILALSLASFVWPTGPWTWFKNTGVPVKDNAVQSECFALCAFGLALGAVKFWHGTDKRRALIMAALAVLFFADVFLIYISKTGIIVAVTLLVLLLIQIEGWRRIALIAAPLLVLSVVALWISAPAQRRLAEISTDINAPQETLSTASRIDFWNKAIVFLKRAPVFGNGTGSIRPMYQAMEATNPSPFGSAVPDPHNQFLHIALQVGLVGGALLLAMWTAHFFLFLSRDVAALMGLAVVLQNFVGSLFNSHLSQVTQGMVYCLAVGLLGAIVRTSRAVATTGDPAYETADGHAGTSGAHGSSSGKIANEGAASRA